MITERQSRILKALMKEYIKTAEPVSSGFLAEKYDFGLCSSAIRIEMQNLIQSNYLEQPHTSAGRVPTDKAYRFFVDQMLVDIEKEKEVKFEKMIEEIVERDIEDRFRMAGDLVKKLSELSSSFIIIHYPDDNLSWRSGLEKMVSEPEFLHQNFISEFLYLVDEIEEKFVTLKPQNEIKIFIGEEIPILKSCNMSIICARMTSISESEIEANIALIGPKRMNYGKNISLINHLNKILSEFK
ncbi:MAG: hypothetical protein WCX30_02010 [Candidatus Paceibacterota bacterium]|jgi:heat-inducible transcriptional repressor|nr:hypothetical protein [bacterium]